MERVRGAMEDVGRDGSVGGVVLGIGDTRSEIVALALPAFRLSHPAVPAASAGKSNVRPDAERT